MAQAVNIDVPVFGYFVTWEYAEILAYVNEILRTHNRSCVFLLHASALFEREGNVQELHLPMNSPVILDPQMPQNIVDEVLMNQYYLTQEPEAYDNVEGSGWSLIPNTTRFWFKIYPCQPNNGADPINDNNVVDNTADTPPTARRKFNYLLYAIIEYYARGKNLQIPRERFLKFEYLEKVNELHGMGFPQGDFEIEINLQDLSDYHRGLGFLNLRVFSMRGNILYATKLTPNNDEFIDLYLNSNNQFALVLNLWSLFHKKYDRMFCMRCLKWVKKEGHSCEKVMLSSKTDEVNLPDIPWGRHALTAYADFESYIKNTYHNISGWGCVVVNQNNEIIDNDNKNLLDENMLIKAFIEYLTRVCVEFAEKINEETLECPICTMPVLEDDDVILGTNFINGKSGTHHMECWEHPKNTMYVFFHNFRGYDSHFLIKELVENVNVTFMSASSMEKFNCITINGWKYEYEQGWDYRFLRITFKDTFNFFTCSLAKMVDMVEDWRYTPEEGRASKGIFPYEWFDDPEKLNATELPPFPWHNSLNNSITVPVEALELWMTKGFTHFHQYHDYYMMLDVLQLCDAFEEFRRTCVAEFQTDPVHFQGAPSLTWYLGVCQNPKLFKIIRDKGVYMDIQHNIRGGISQAMSRYCTVEDKPDESIFFLDVNSLYSKCMTYKMPGKYLYSRSDLPENWRELYNENTNETAIMVVDLVYPEHLHDRDWAYPLAPHHYNDRLCTTFKNKENYMVHAELLAFYLDRGMILEDFHYMYVFNQDYTLRDYVQNNIEKRRHTNSEVMKTLYKLLNNSLYGKTCENVNKYRKFGVVVDESIMQDEFADVYPFNQYNTELSTSWNIVMCGDRYLVEQPVTTVLLNKPIQMGFTILEFAKREIYKFLAIVQDHFGEAVVPLYTDTDSLMFWCDFKEPWKVFLDSPLAPYLDFEKVPAHWGVRTPDTDKQSGLWSVEAGGKEIVEYVGLRAKCYAYRFRDNEVVIKNKGVPKSAMIGDIDETPREQITIEHYKKALFDGQMFNISHYAIRSNKHEVSTTQQYKLGINANDLKRATTTAKAISLPFGYKGSLFKDLVTDADDTSHLDP